MFVSCFLYPCIFNRMSLFQAMILGIVQGFTEFLPVSSSAHLIFIPKFLGWADQGLAFDAIIHLGTLLAVIIYFRKRMITLIRGLYADDANHADRRLGWMIVLSVIPALFAGFLMSEVFTIEIRSPLVIAVSLIFWGIVLGVADRFALKHESMKALKQWDNPPAGEAGRTMEYLSWPKALFISCAQVISLIPGTSRSGITMTAGLFSKLTKEAAAEFAFLMSIPVIAASGMLKLFEMVKTGGGEVVSMPLIVGLLFSAVSGFFAISALMKFIKHRSFMPFAVYRVVVGILILVFLV